MSDCAFAKGIKVVPTPFTIFLEIGNDFASICFDKSTPLNTLRIREREYREIVTRLVPNKAFKKLDAQLTRIHKEFEAALIREADGPETEILAFLERRERYIRGFEEISCASLLKTPQVLKAKSDVAIAYSLLNCTERPLSPSEFMRAKIIHLFTLEIRGFLDGSRLSPALMRFQASLVLRQFLIQAELIDSSRTGIIEID